MKLKPLIAAAHTLLEGLSASQRATLATIAAYRKDVTVGPGRRVGDKAVPRRTAKALEKLGLVSLTTETGKNDTVRGAYKNRTGSGTALTTTNYFAAETYALPTPAGLAALAAKDA